jgi:hypothetical protein
MNRLVQNQKERRAKLTKHFEDVPNMDILDERTFYHP